MDAQESLSHSLSLTLTLSFSLSCTDLSPLRSSPVNHKQILLNPRNQKPPDSCWILMFCNQSLSSIGFLWRLKPRSSLTIWFLIVLSKLSGHRKQKETHSPRYECGAREKFTWWLLLTYLFNSFFVVHSLWISSDWVSGRQYFNTSVLSMYISLFLCLFSSPICLYERHLKIDTILYSTVANRISCTTLTLLSFSLLFNKVIPPPEIFIIYAVWIPLWKDQLN